MTRDGLVARRAELQALYDETHSRARELAGAIAAFDEVITLFDTPEPSTPTVEEG